VSRPPKRARADHKKTAQALRRRPGVWLAVGEYRSNVSAEGIARDIRNGYSRRPDVQNPYAPRGSFEARMVLTEFGTNVIARYIGGGQ
jgi:hypothetical protein